MMASITAWLTPAAQDPRVARKEYLLNRVLAILAAVTLLHSLLALISWGLGQAQSIDWLISLALLPFYGLAYWLGRRGAVQLAASIPVLMLMLVTFRGIYAVGLGHSTVIGLALVVILAGQLIGLWPAVVIALLAAGVYAGVGFVQQAGRLADALPAEQSLWVDLPGIGLGLLVIAVLIWMSQRDADRALDQAQEAEQKAQIHARDVEDIQGRLERQVEERTQEITEFALQLQKSLEEQQRLWDTVQRLSIPIVPVHEGIIVTPLIGHIDIDRAERLVEELLVAIEEHDARMVIMDVTGLPVMDSQVAQSLIQAAHAARMLGTEMVLVGIRPDVAETVVQRQLDLSSITTKRDLQAGVQYALAHTRPCPIEPEANLAPGELQRRSSA